MEMRVFDWKDDALIFNATDSSVRKMLKKRKMDLLLKDLRNVEDLYDLYTEDIFEFFCKAAEMDYHEDIGSEVLERHFRREFSSIRLYHACRPTSLLPYYRDGILPTEQNRLENEARDFFCTIDKSQNFKISLERAMESFAPDAFTEQEKRVFLVLDDRVFLEDSGHYLIYGSEYLLSIAAKILPYSPKYRLALRGRGVPTILACDVPMQRLTHQLSEMWGKILLRYLFELAGKKILFATDRLYRHY